MEAKWLSKNNLPKLIIFFNGWSLDDNIIKHLKSAEYDILMLNNYINLEIPKEILAQIGKYEEKNIIAWSFGVWACGNTIKNFGKIKNAVAINGTTVAIDNNFSIPEKIFNLTLSTLSEKTYPKFFQNMFSSKKYNENLMPERTIDSQKQELIQIQNMSLKQEKINCAKLFNKVLIGTKDRIIPPENQINFWNTNKAEKIIEVDEGHYIFDLFKSWEEILA